MKMARNRKAGPSPSFYKILINHDFTNKLKLPRAFVQKHRRTLPRVVRLSPSFARNFWIVKLKQMGDEGCYFFTGSGWRKFAQDMELKILEFLVFWFSGNSTFRVSVYAINGRERGFPGTAASVKRSRIPIVEEIHDAAAAGAESPIESDGRNPYCEVVYKKYHSSRLEIRKPFSVDAGLLGKKSVSMEYVGGFCVDAVALAHRKRHGGVITELAAGWPEFSRANKLGIGRTYAFEFIQGRNLIRVRPLLKQITGASASAKQSRMPIVEESHDAASAGAESPVESDDPNPYCEVVYRKYHRFRLELRKQFLVDADLFGKESVSMEYVGGCRVDFVALAHRKKKYHHVLVELAAGWPEFSRANELVIGKTYSFEFIKGENVIQVRPISA